MKFCFQYSWLNCVAFCLISPFLWSFFLSLFSFFLRSLHWVVLHVFMVDVDELKCPDQGRFFVGWKLLALCLGLGPSRRRFLGITLQFLSFCFFQLSGLSLSIWSWFRLCRLGLFVSCHREKRRFKSLYALSTKKRLDDKLRHYVAKLDSNITEWEKKMNPSTRLFMLWFVSLNIKYSCQSKV